jgi:hypothetical protein
MKMHAIRSTRPVVEMTVHDLVGDESQPGLLSGQIGVKAVARRKVDAGQVIFQETGEVGAEASMHSIQVGIDTHCAINGEGRFTAHSFSPNCRINVVEMSTHPIDFVALRPIAEGEALSFDYCTTEWAMAAPFVDHETGRECQGFKYLPEVEKLRNLRAGLVAPHVMRLWLEEIHSTR